MEAQRPLTRFDTFVLEKNLDWNVESRLLICKQCQCILGKTFARHLRAQHGFAVSREEEVLIKDSCSQFASEYLTSVNHLLRPVDGIPTLNGFRCTICPQYGVSSKHIRHHCKTAHGDPDFISPCLVQSLRNGRNRSYFGVLGEAEVAEVPVPIVDDLAATIAADLLDVVPGPEHIRNRSLFYLQNGWYVGEGEDPYHGIQKGQLLADASQEAEPQLFAVSAAVELVLMTSFSAVNETCKMLRFSLEGSAKTFSRLETESSVAEYVAAALRLFRFAWRVSVHPLLSQFVPPALSAALQAVVTGASPKAIFAFFDTLLMGKFALLPETCLPVLFLRFSCYNEDGSLLRLEEVSRLCAKLLYLIKLTALQGIVLAEEEERMEVRKRLTAAVALTNDNLLSYFAMQKGHACREAVDLSTPKIFSQDDVGERLLVDGEVITFTAIQAAYRGAIQRASALISELAFHLPLEVGRCVDVISERQLGFSLSGSPNPAEAKAFRVLLLSHVLSNAQLAASFSYRNVEGQHRFVGEAASVWLAKYDELTELLLLVIHIGYGMPARATELCPLIIRNGRSTMRSVYLLDGRIMILSSYSKTRSVTGQSPKIARFLDAEASKLMLKNLVFLRPLARMIAAGSLAGQLASGYNDALFVAKGKPFDSEKVSSVFRARFHRLSGVALKFIDYRHVSKIFARKAGLDGQIVSAGLAGDGGEDGEMEEGAVDLQHGHTGATANRVYGRTSNENPGLTTEKAAAFRALSSKWHDLLVSGFVRPRRPAPVLPAAPPAALNLDRFAPAGPPTHATVVPAPVTPLTPDQPEGRFRNRYDQVMAEFDREVEQAPRRRRVGDVPAGSMMTVRESVMVDDALRELLGPDTDFRSEEQRRLVQLVVKGENNVLAVIPTGHGKSLSFELFAKLHPARLAVVVLPTISLRADMEERLARHGFRTTRDGSEVLPEHHFLLLTPEAFALQRDALLTLSLRKRLGAVFVDECHLSVTDSTFRPAYRSLYKAVLLDVPLVLLTATLPPSMEPALFDLFFPAGDLPVVVRMKTNRPRLSYSFQTEKSLAGLMSSLNGWDTFGDASGRCIVYCPTVDEARRICDQLRLEGRPAALYTGQEEAEENRAAFRSWRAGEAPIMVATSAFGVGIDYAHVRRVIMWGLPYSLLDFAQLSGRAGRDGRRARVVTILNVAAENARCQRESDPSRAAALQAVISFATERSVCRRAALSRVMDACPSDCRGSGSDRCDICLPFAGHATATPVPIVPTILRPTTPTTPLPTAPTTPIIPTTAPRPAAPIAPTTPRATAPTTPGLIAPVTPGPTTPATPALTAPNILRPTTPATPALTAPNILRPFVPTTPAAPRPTAPAPSLPQRLVALGTPTQPSTANFVHAARQLRTISQLSKGVDDWLSFLKGNCIICALEGKGLVPSDKLFCSARHSSTCYGCFLPSCRAGWKCPWKAKSIEKGHCYRCFLPLKLDGQSFHKQTAPACDPWQECFKGVVRRHLAVGALSDADWQEFISEPAGSRSLVQWFVETCEQLFKDLK